MIPSLIGVDAIQHVTRDRVLLLGRQLGYGFDRLIEKGAHR